MSENAHHDARPARERTPRGRRRSILISGVGVLLLGVLTLGVALSSPGPANLPTGHFTERLERCAPAEQTELAYAEAGTAACLRETLLDAAEMGALQTARLDLGALVEERPWLHNYCHLAEHQVGSVIMGEPDRVPELIVAHPVNTCSWGIGHGLLETFGAARPSETAWSAVTATCRGLRDMPAPYPEVYSLCADGLGHAAWDHHRELTGAVLRCEALVEESAVAACTTGIMMQQYRPAETGDQPPLDAVDLTGYCSARWPAGTRAAEEGCATGIGYVLSLALVGDVISTTLNDGGNQQEAARRAGDGLRLALEICDSQGRWNDVCAGSVLVNLPEHLIDEPEARTLLCSVVTESRRAACSTGT